MSRGQSYINGYNKGVRDVSGLIMEALENAGYTKEAARNVRDILMERQIQARLDVTAKKP